LRKAIPACRGCDLFEYATQAVFGEGPDSSPVVFVGEQPGDKEDRSGRPFVGPAGRILDQALTDAGLPRSEVYLTNAVKHFKFTERGKRRLHQKPNALEIRSCSPWLEAELHLIKPRILVCLGATAALTVFGPDYRLTKSRGQFVEHAWAQHATSTIHPSAILRSRDAETRQLEYDRFVEDLRKVRSLL
jgi:uracil-DNA glycosylase family protein